jgi:hypothetical protein
MLSIADLAECMSLSHSLCSFCLDAGQWQLAVEAVSDLAPVHKKVCYDSKAIEEEHAFMSKHSWYNRDNEQRQLGHLSWLVQTDPRGHSQRPSKEAWEQSDAEQSEEEQSDTEEYLEYIPQHPKQDPWESEDDLPMFPGLRLEKNNGSEEGSKEEEEGNDPKLEEVPPADESHALERAAAVFQCSEAEAAVKLKRQYQPEAIRVMMRRLSHSTPSQVRARSPVPGMLENISDGDLKDSISGSQNPVIMHLYGNHCRQMTPANKTSLKPNKTSLKPFCPFGQFAERPYYLQFCCLLPFVQKCVQNLREPFSAEYLGPPVQEDDADDSDSDEEHGEYCNRYSTNRVDRMAAILKRSARGRYNLMHRLAELNMAQTDLSRELTMFIAVAEKGKAGKVVSNEFTDGIAEERGDSCGVHTNYLFYKRSDPQFDRCDMLAHCEAYEDFAMSVAGGIGMSHSAKRKFLGKDHERHPLYEELSTAVIGSDIHMKMIVRANEVLTRLLGPAVAASLDCRAEARRDIDQLLQMHPFTYQEDQEEEASIVQDMKRARDAPPHSL